VNKELFDVDLQLYQLNPKTDPFFLIFAADNEMLTDALNVNYDPDYVESEFSTENSFVRQVRKMTHIGGTGLTATFQDRGFAFSSYSSVAGDPIVSAGDDPVNTDMGDTTGPGSK